MSDSGVGGETPFFIHLMVWVRVLVSLAIILPLTNFIAWVISRYYIDIPGFFQLVESPIEEIAMWMGLFVGTTIVSMIVVLPIGILFSHRVAYLVSEEYRDEMDEIVRESESE